jgi:hypothetical protein
MGIVKIPESVLSNLKSNLKWKEDGLCGLQDCMVVESLQLPKK